MASDAKKYIPFLDPNRQAGQFKTEDIGTDTLLATDIAVGAVGTSELAANAVETVKILDANVTTAKIADLNVTTGKLAAAAVTQAKLSYEVVSVTVVAAATSGTATVTDGSIILGYYPTGNQDQFVDNIAIASTTLTITLAAAATADNTFNVILLKV